LDYLPVQLNHRTVRASLKSPVDNQNRIYNMKAACQVELWESEYHDRVDPLRTSLRICLTTTSATVISMAAV